MEEGHEEDEQPDNISIEVGTNRYSAEDHMNFRDAIVRQLTMQASSVGAELTGEGHLYSPGGCSLHFHHQRRSGGDQAVLYCG